VSDSPYLAATLFSLFGGQLIEKWTRLLVVGPRKEEVVCVYVGSKKPQNYLCPD
jgi:hypothetical protein